MGAHFFFCKQQEGTGKQKIQQESLRYKKGYKGDQQNSVDIVQLLGSIPLWLMYNHGKDVWT